MLTCLFNTTLLPAIMGPMGFESIRFSVTHHAYHQYGWYLIATHKEDTVTVGYEIFHITAADAFLEGVTCLFKLLEARYGERQITSSKEHIITRINVYGQSGKEV